ncbi:hypothetical protein LCGC14_1481750 [marine sediment metagenome]|uniref:NB-ARC domain-containing protein n=1 Tax=marine sediment metagenome TaxID=412755 RepID=A0A0F9JA08_9ZZZZ|nr:hypothetical protein [archaeon]
MVVEIALTNVSSPIIKIVDPGEKYINNLPSADYDLDGGFVGRKNEIKEIKKKIYSKLDRIITIMGAGGVGKTALALEVAKRIVEDEKNPLRAIIWFSAKEEILTDIEIVKIEPSIKMSQAGTGKNGGWTQDDVKTLIKDSEWVYDLWSSNKRFGDFLNDFNERKNLYRNYGLEAFIVEYYGIAYERFFNQYGEGVYSLCVRVPGFFDYSGYLNINWRDMFDDSVDYSSMFPKSQ